MNAERLFWESNRNASVRRVQIDVKRAHKRALNGNKVE